MVTVYSKLVCIDEEGKMRNLCIFLKFLKVTYTHFVLGDIDFTKKV